MILHYLRLSLWPGSLCLDYAWPVARDAGPIVPPAVAIGVLLGVTVAALKRKPALGFVGAWFFVVLSPTSSFIPIKDPVFEHRMYLPLAAVVVLAVVAGDALLRFLSRRLSLGDGRRRGVAAVLVTVVVIAGTGATIRRNRVYHSRRAMWSDVLARYPDNARAQVNLGLALTDEGDAVGALERYRAALEGKSPRSRSKAVIEARFSLANALVRTGRFDQAVEEYRRLLKVKPTHVRARYNLADVLRRQNRIEEAVAEFREILRRRPNHAGARQNLEALGAGPGGTDAE